MVSTKLASSDAEIAQSIALMALTAMALLSCFIDALLRLRWFCVPMRLGTADRITDAKVPTDIEMSKKCGFGAAADLCDAMAAGFVFYLVSEPFTQSLPFDAATRSNLMRLVLLILVASENTTFMATRIPKDIWVRIVISSLVAGVVILASLPLLWSGCTICTSGLAMGICIAAAVFLAGFLVRRVFIAREFALLLAVWALGYSAVIAACALGAVDTTLTTPDRSIMELQGVFDGDATERYFGLESILTMSWVIINKVVFFSSATLDYINQRLYYMSLPAPAQAAKPVSVPYNQGRMLSTVIPSSFAVDSISDFSSSSFPSASGSTSSTRAPVSIRRAKVPAVRHAYDD
jgi:hypothetical protein